MLLLGLMAVMPFSKCGSPIMCRSAARSSGPLLFDGSGRPYKSVDQTLIVTYSQVLHEGQRFGDTLGSMCAILRLIWHFLSNVGVQLSPGQRSDEEDF